MNRSELARVFSNLLNNAVKYSDGDLEITLSDLGEITFANTAKELSTVEVEQLFDRFYTVEAAHHSTGLGLSIARTLVKRMGGTITADYRHGERSLCRLSFSAVSFPITITNGSEVLLRSPENLSSFEVIPLSFLMLIPTLLLSQIFLYCSRCFGQLTGLLICLIVFRIFLRQLFLQRCDMLFKIFDFRNIA